MSGCGNLAKFKIQGLDEYAVALSRLGKASDAIAKKAVYAGAGIVADQIRRNLSALPEEKFRFLRGEDTFTGTPERQKKDLLESLGITEIDIDNQGDWNAKIGFDGYGSIPTKNYPQGLPNQLVARAIESGSSVRQKTRFVGPAVNAKKKEAQQEMGRIVDEEMKKSMK